MGGRRKKALARIKSKDNVYKEKLLERIKATSSRSTPPSIVTIPPMEKRKDKEARGRFEENNKVAKRGKIPAELNSGNATDLD